MAAAPCLKRGQPQKLPLPSTPCGEGQRLSAAALWAKLTSLEEVLQPSHFPSLILHVRERISNLPEHLRLEADVAK